MVEQTNMVVNILGCFLPLALLLITLKGISPLLYSTYSLSVMSVHCGVFSVVSRELVTSPHSS